MFGFLVEIVQIEVSLEELECKIGDAKMLGPETSCVKPVHL